MKELKDFLLLESNDKNDKKYRDALALSVKLYKKFSENHCKQHNEPVDCTGRKVELNDIVLFGEKYYIIPLVVKDILSDNRLDVWDISKGQNYRVDCGDVFKLDDPKKYL